MKNWLFLIVLIFINKLSLAQNENAEMADIMRRDGKIYVVVAVILIIFIGIILYLVRLDSKISKLEKQQ
ncbi:MAG: CcmD family protein [Bacteroidota bacterium]|jgi:CcmD family protein|nr:CcmD family protein [Flavisolibacter sp.]MDQ3552415.1 CcmD family protein [Bacteroidota bacterium]